MLQELHKLDQELTLLINSWDSTVSDRIWQIFSDIPVWIPLYLCIILFIMHRLGWKKGLMVIAAAALTFGICDQLSNLAKELTCRVRPLNDSYMLEKGLNVLEKGSLSFSFFSAHAANAFGLATCTYIGLRDNSGKSFRAYAAGMYTWAFLVALSRVFVGKHYLGDVAAGSLIGLLAGALTACIAGKLISRFNIR